MKYLISIIIPVYNVEKYLDKCLKSIVNQTYRNLEVILVDDGSKDGSGKICDDWAKKDNRIVIIHTDNRGVSNARNTGLSLASGDFIGFVDPDDYLEPLMYEELINQVDSGVDIVCCNYYYTENDNKYAYIQNVNRYIMNQTQFQDFCVKYSGTVWNKIYRKEKLKNIEFNKDIYILEDLLYNLEVSENIKKAVYINKPYYYYIIHNNSVLRKKDVKKATSSLFAQEKIINILTVYKSKVTNDLKLEFIFNLNYLNSEYNINTTEYNYLRSLADSYINDGIFFKKSPMLLKVKVLIINYLPKVYFTLKRVICHENK